MESVAFGNRSFKESITMIPDKRNQIPLCIGLYPVSTAQTKFYIFWKQFSLALKEEQIKKFTWQREFPLAMANGQGKFFQAWYLIA